MIIYKTVRWKNLLSTGNVFTEIDLKSSSSTLIVGENGAGKSTFIEAIFYAMFGRPFRKINKPQLVNAINKKNLLVELEFSVGSREYMIRRGMKPNVFEIYQDGVMINQDAAIRDYQDYLEKSIFKLNHKSAGQIIILGSRSYTPFMQLSAGQRREIIEDLLDLQIFSNMNNILKQKVSDHKDAIKDVKYNLDLTKEKIDMQTSYIENIKSNHEKTIQENNKKILEYKNSIEEYKNEIASITTKINELSEYTKDHDTVNSTIREIEMLKNQFHTKLGKLNDDISFYETNNNCPTCKQDIEHRFKHEIITTKNTQIEGCTEALEALNLRYEKFTKKLNEITKTNLKITNYNNSVTEYNFKISSALDFISKIEKENDRLSTDYMTDNKDKKKLNELKNELKTHLSTHKKLIEEKSIIDVVSVLLKDGGIKSKIIKQYIPVMNKLINKYLAAMELSISFELDENFNETVKSRHRDEFSYDSFSEGEKARIDLAILFAWRAIAKLRNACSTNLLILDETFDGSLDNTGTEELLKIIQSITSDSNVFVISHKSDQMVDKFSNIIKFNKIKNYSQIAQ